MDDDFDLIEVSGREPLPVADRIGLLEQDVLWLRGVGRAPVRDGKSWKRGGNGAEIHDFVNVTEWASNLCREFRRVPVEKFVKHYVSDGLLSRCECAVMAWKRGGYIEGSRVRSEQRQRANTRRRRVGE